MHEVLCNRLGGLSLPRKSVVGLTDHPNMTRIHTAITNANDHHGEEIGLASTICRQDKNTLSVFSWKYTSYPEIIMVSEAKYKTCK